VSTVFARIEVLPHDDSASYIVEVGMSTAFVWETTYPGRSLGDLNAKSRFSAHDMYELAYVGSKRAGKAVPSKLMEFVEANDVRSVVTPPKDDDVDVPAEDEVADVGNPTDEVPSTTT
jgi:hypothetical protein